MTRRTGFWILTGMAIHSAVLAAMQYFGFVVSAEQQLINVLLLFAFMVVVRMFGQLTH